MLYSTVVAHHSTSWGHSSVGRAPRSQCGGHRFEAGWLHHISARQGNWRRASEARLRRFDSFRARQLQDVSPGRTRKSERGPRGRRPGNTSSRLPHSGASAAHLTGTPRGTRTINLLGDKNGKSYRTPLYEKRVVPCMGDCGGCRNLSRVHLVRVRVTAAALCKCCGLRPAATR